MIRLEAGQKALRYTRGFAAGFGPPDCMKWTSTAGPYSVNFLISESVAAAGAASEAFRILIIAERQSGGS